MNMGIFKAEREDLQKILQLQYLSYQSEAALFGSRDIPPLKQTLDEVIAEYNNGIILKMTDDHDVIIGSIRATAIANIGGTMPEDLPTPEKSIQQIEKEQMARLKAKAKKGKIMLDE